MEKRVYNFSAGPSMLPLEVLEQAQRELVCYPSAGMSVMEMSHRSKTFENILEKAKADLKELMHIPDNYKILFLQGGGSTQFAMIPMNLMNKNNKADYVITGQWAKKAAAEAERYGKVNIVASSADSTFDHIPTLDPSKFDPEADYFYITLNNTIYGTRWTELPDTGNVPLVGDMSSSILSQEIDITKFGLLYAGAQKNLGPAGVTVVIVREDLLGNAMDFTPTMLRYDIHAENNSLYNTPPTYGIYFMGLVFDWVKRQGGVAALQKINERKAAILYDFLDQSELFLKILHIHAILVFGANGVSQWNNTTLGTNQKDRIEICTAHAHIGGGKAQRRNHFLSLQAFGSNLPMICIEKLICLPIQTPDCCRNGVIEVGCHKSVSGILTVEKVARRLK